MNAESRSTERLSAADEIELRGDDIAGIAVHVAARVMGQAEGDEVLVSRTVRDLTAGSGLVFSDRGVHALEGVPDEWQLYALSWRQADWTSRGTDAPDADTPRSGCYGDRSGVEASRSRWSPTSRASCSLAA